MQKVKIGLQEQAGSDSGKNAESCLAPAASVAMCICLTLDNV